MVEVTVTAHSIAKPASPRPGLDAVLKHIDTHLSEPLCLSDLAGLMCLSVWRFATVFRQHMGISPYRYVHRRRLAHAQALLQQGMPAAWVASEAGFYDQSHLTRCFRRELGLTPRQFQDHQADPTLPVGRALPLSTTPSHCLPFIPPIASREVIK